jgi:hypothetical protein
MLGPILPQRNLPYPSTYATPLILTFGQSSNFRVFKLVDIFLDIELFALDFVIYFCQDGGKSKSWRKKW